MLARTPFLSAAALGLGEAEHRALTLTLAALERGDLVLFRDPEDELIGDSINRPGVAVFSGHFNMNYWCNELKHTCGSVACIGGTAEMLGKVTFDLNNEPLERLFYPPLPPGKWEAITPAQAAAALRSYLTTGTPNWDGALAP